MTTQNDEKIINLPHIYKPRSYQLNILKALDRGIKKAVWCVHRRGGKDVTIFNWCIKQLYREPSVCFYIMPSYAQAKKVIWDAVNNDGQRILDYIPPEIIANKNQQEMKIRLDNGSLFQLVGSENIDSLMGTNPKIVVFSEYSLQSPAAWEYLRPILKVNKGYSIFIGTPRGRNHFYELCRTAEITEDWFYEKLTIKDTGVLSDEDVQNEIKEGMSEEVALQEYYCSFDRGVDGAYYSKIINKMREEGRISTIDYEPYKMVYTSWDLGWDDATAIIFFQLNGNRINIIDCESHSTKTLAWYKDLLMNKGYKYGGHLFPHDVDQVDGLSTGCTRKEILEDLKIPVTNVPRHFIQDGIESTKAILSSRVYIDEKKCADLIKSLDHYHRDWDEKHKVYSNKPRHDFSSHYADAMRYLATGLKKLDNNDSDPDGDAKAVRAFWG